MEGAWLKLGGQVCEQGSEGEWLKSGVIQMSWGTERFEDCLQKCVHSHEQREYQGSSLPQRSKPHNQVFTAEEYPQGWLVKAKVG